MTTTDASSLIAEFDAVRTRQAKGKASRSAHRGQVSARTLSVYCKLAFAAALAGAVLSAGVVSF